jgi:predicted Rossmann fold nucleotide-binding protein DprA/Smf involved in DNA uptake
MPVVSGGARGVDQFSMTAALDAGGTTIGALADSLLKKSLERNARKAIAEGRLLLISACHPNARFTVGTAMGRNKLIYAMADYGLVVSAEHKKGGTWAGADEELKREHSIPVFVRQGEGVPLGNSKLLGFGAVPWPDKVDRENLREQLTELSAQCGQKKTQKNMSLLDLQEAQK